MTPIPATASDYTSTGPATLSYTDTGVAGTPTTTVPGTTNNALESAYEANQSLPAAFSTLGIKDFGSDASKPYPNPATATFANGSPPATQYAKA